MVAGTVYRSIYILDSSYPNNYPILDIAKDCLTIHQKYPELPSGIYHVEYIAGIYHCKKTFLKKNISS